MKRFLFLSLFCALASISTTSNAQAPTFDCYLTNDTFISPIVYQFDIYLLRTGTNVFEYAETQWGINIGSACANGGTLTPSMIGGSSQLSNVSQVPVTFSLFSNYCFNIAPRVPPGPGNGSIISDIHSGCLSPGTRVGTFKITNTVPFSCTCMNLAFNFVAAAGRTQTKIFAYVSGVNTDITAYGTFYSYNVFGNCLKYCGNGINEPTFSNVLSVYPNPSSVKITVTAPLPSGKEITITISNALGAIIRTEKRNWEKNFTVDLRSLDEGIYFLKISDNGREWIGRFVKQ